MKELYTVYKASHRPSGKIYVGQTKLRLEFRIGQHWSAYHSPTPFNVFITREEFLAWLHRASDYQRSK